MKSHDARQRKESLIAKKMSVGYDIILLIRSVRRIAWEVLEIEVNLKSIKNI